MEFDYLVVTLNPIAKAGLWIADKMYFLWRDNPIRSIYSCALALCSVYTPSVATVMISLFERFRIQRF